MLEDFNYTQLKSHLIDNGLIMHSGIFDYQGLDEKVNYRYSYLFEFYQKNLYQGPFKDLVPSENKAIYFRHDYSFNVRAFKQKEHYLIGWNIGLAKKLHDIFITKGSLINDFFKNYTYPVELDNGVSLLQFQFVNNFIFYHEFAHLVQFERGMQIKKMFNERIKITEPFKVIHHIAEYDADIFSTIYIGSDIMRYISERAKQNILDINDFITTFCIAIYLLFNLFSGINKSIYFTKYDHPHPMIRIVYILDVIIDYCRKWNVKKEYQYNIDYRKIISKLFSELDKVFTALDLNRTETQLLMDFTKNSKNIKTYINELNSKNSNWEYSALNKNNSLIANHDSLKKIS